MSLEDLGLLAEHERLRARARGDQHIASVPLLGLAVLLAGGAAVAVPQTPAELLYWLVATPALFLGITWWQRRRSAALGAGRPGRGYQVGAGVAVLLFVLVFPVLFLAPVAAACAVMLVMGLRRRNRYLAGWSAVLGVLGVLTQLGFFDNRLYELNQWLQDYAAPRDGYFDGAPLVTRLALAATAAAAGLWALRQERR
jgi:hypothetical protein